MKDLLAPCPFCGGGARRFTIGDDEPSNAGGDVICCQVCGASSAVEFGRKENLVRNWNRRVSVNSPAALDVLAERKRQISAEGWTPQHDDEHGQGELAQAAGCYAMFSAASNSSRAATDLPGSLAALGKPVRGWAAFLQLWPFDRSWWKPTDRRRDLVKAGALILAEIERLDRAAKEGRA